MIAGRNINNLRINNFRWYHLYGRKWKRTKEPLDESERDFGPKSLQMVIAAMKLKDTYSLEKKSSAT